MRSLSLAVALIFAFQFPSIAAPAKAKKPPAKAAAKKPATTAAATAARLAAARRAMLMKAAAQKAAAAKAKKKPAPKKKPPYYWPAPMPTSTPYPILNPVPTQPTVTTPVLPSLPVATPTPVPTATPIPTPTPEPRSNIWALLIGVSKYANPQITPLRFPSEDANAIRDALTDRQLGALPASNVRVVADEQATRAGIFGAVDSFLKPNVRPGDQVIIFMAGHGIAKGIGTEAKSYLLPYDVRGVTIQALDASAVNLEQLSAKLGELPASQFVVFADACREDPTPGRGGKGNQLSDVMSRGVLIDPKNQAERPSSVTFFACRIGERAYEDATLQHGVFTYYILDAIKAAAVPTKPDGAIHMDRLVTYVSDKVSSWAKKASASGDFEFAQTPDGMTSDPPNPVVLMRVRRAVAANAIPPAPPRLLLETFPENARVTVDGRPVREGTVNLAAGGEHRVEVTAPGFAPVARTVNVLGGMQNMVPVRLEPGSRGVGMPAPPPQASDTYARAVDAEANHNYPQAMSLYQQAIRNDQTFVPAYERLAALYARQGARERRISILIDLVKRVPNDARGYTLLSRAYSRYAEIEYLKNPVGQEPEKKKKKGLLDRLRSRDDDDEDQKVGDYRLPRTAKEAALFSRKAADQAARLEPQSDAAQLAMGFALVVNDDKGRNRQDALTAFGRAVAAGPQQAENYYGLGFGIRSFAVKQGEGRGRDAEINRAVGNLKQAIELRPDFYEAHRELGLCYYLLDNTEAATASYELANSYRGEATDRDEYASNDVALASLHQARAVKAGGNRGDRYRLSSQGYIEDAQETSPDLKAAVSILGSAGLSTRLTDYLPASLKRILGLPDKIEGKIEDKIRDKLPGGIRFP